MPTYTRTHAQTLTHALTLTYIDACVYLYAHTYSLTRAHALTTPAQRRAAQVALLERLVGPADGGPAPPGEDPARHAAALALRLRFIREQIVPGL